MLVEAIAAGDLNALRLLMDRHTPHIMVLARRMTGNTHDAEDIAQEAFLRVWRHADRFVPRGGGVGGWVKRIVVNLCLDRLRRSTGVDIDAIAEPADDRPNAEAQLATVETARLVEAEIARLPERQRMAVVMCYFEDMSNAEAADMLGVSVSALESLLIRGRRTLKERFAALKLADGVSI